MASTSFDRAAAVYITKLADEADDYDEVVAQMKNVASKVEELTADERKLLRTVYDKRIMQRRDSWGILSTLEKNEESVENEENAARINWYKRKVEMEIARICTEVLSITDEYLIPSTTTLEASVFFYTMKGDYYRYRAQIKTGTDRQQDGNLALQAYKIAMVAAETELPRAHPSRLTLDLNLAVLYHEILGNTDRASGIAKQAFDEAIPAIRDLIDIEAKKDSKRLLCRLNENVILWSKFASFAD